MRRPEREGEQLGLGAKAWWKSAFGGDAIEGGGGYSAAVSGGVGVGPIVGQKEENIGSRGGEGGGEKLAARDGHTGLR